MSMKTNAPKEEPKEEPKYVEPGDPDGDVELFVYKEEDVDASIAIQKESPEALCSATTNLYSRGGGSIMLTVRGSHPRNVIDEMGRALMYAEDWYGLVQTTDTREKKAQPQHSARQEKQQVQSDEMYGGYPVIDKGVSPISQIVVMKDPKSGALHVEFAVGKFTWPFKDFRSPSAINDTFDSDLGFQVEHFEKPAVYVQEDWVDNIVAEWVKIQKGDKSYYNVTRVRKE